ncbi:MAG: hypothetical protein M1833_003604 [Piccolia ochrophora]|nr:MAG: hypothetical protein M1833_003604 [Piccolia ochrophora]
MDTSKEIDSAKEVPRDADTDSTTMLKASPRPLESCPQPCGLPQGRPFLQVINRATCPAISNAFTVFRSDHPTSDRVPSDEEAAECVIRHFINRHLVPRQLRAEASLIRLVLSSPLCEARIEDVVHLADVVFFEDLLASKVEWHWSNPTQSRFRVDVLGTTEVRPDANGDFETRVTLSKPMLQNPAYGQRLVLSAIFHEMIHSYLFIRRGFEARCEGGHSQGFREIARLIDDWVGDERYLQLYLTKANLESFETRQAEHGWNQTTSAWGQDNGFESTKHTKPSKGRTRNPHG